MANGSAPTITLNNGVDIPQIGYGVFLTPPEETERAVLEAFEVGYRHVDTAQAYRNEEGVGAAVAASGLPREDLFLTTKVWISNAGEERAARSIDGSLRRLGTDYIDLLLVHQPFGDYYGTYRAMEKALAAGKVRAIGVSNFFPDRFVDLAQHVEVPPAVNQMETHVFNQQADNRAWYAKYDTALESWGPLAQGRTSSSTTPTCGPSPPSTRGRASSTTTTPPSRSASPPTRSRRTDLRLTAAASGYQRPHPAGTFDAAGCGLLRAGTFDAVGDRNPVPARAGCPRPGVDGEPGAGPTAGAGARLRAGGRTGTRSSRRCPRTPASARSGRGRRGPPGRSSSRRRRSPGRRCAGAPRGAL